ncbi:MAG: hypothetical protein E7C13_04210 [Actinomyces sp.]|nr:hypothetical protein [Actinomyces sp.]
MSTIDPSQLTAADLSNPALSAQDLADITAARPDLRPYVATHPSLYPALGQWLADQGVVPAQPPAAEEPVAAESEAPAEESADQGEPFGGAHEDAQPEADAAPTEAADEQPAFEEPAFEESSVEAPAEHEAAHVEPEAPVSEAAEAHDDNLEQAILEGASQPEAPADGGASPALSTEEQVAQSPFSNPPHSDAQPQQGQQAPFGQPGQPSRSLVRSRSRVSRLPSVSPASPVSRSLVRSRSRLSRLPSVSPASRSSVSRSLVRSRSRVSRPPSASPASSSSVSRVTLRPARRRVSSSVLPQTRRSASSSRLLWLKQAR